MNAPRLTRGTVEQETGIEPAGTSLGSWRHTIRRLLQMYSSAYYYTVFADILQTKKGRFAPLFRKFQNPRSFRSATSCT